MSRLHGSVLPSLRRASATSLLKTDRFWVNLWKKEERPGAVARRRWCAPVEDKATVELRTLERAPDAGRAPPSHLHCGHNLSATNIPSRFPLSENKGHHQIHLDHFEGHIVWACY